MKLYPKLHWTLPILGLVLLARPALALWLEISVARNGVVDGQQFTVTTKDVDQFKQFEIKLTPHPRSVSPFLTGQLSLISNDKWVASVPVSERRANGAVTYTFRVVKDAIAQSTFHIHASAYAPVGKGEGEGIFGTAMLGERKVQQIMGGTIYALKLKDFTGGEPR